MTGNKKTECSMAPAIGAVILAAGYSSRMKRFKALLPVAGIPAVERVISCAQNAEVKTGSNSRGISDIVLVTGYRRELLAPVAEKYGIREVHNRDFDRGMFSSIQAGVRALKGRVDGFFLMPVDCPALRQDIFEELLARAENLLLSKDDGASVSGETAGSFESTHRDHFMVPCYMGKKGHPLFIPSCYFDEILSYEGNNGLKGITDKYEEKLDRIEVESESVILDMDDEEGYKEVCDYAERGFRETPLAELASGHRFILLRHGQIKQHREKIFLGQADVPLSDLGKQQAEAAGKRLKAEGSSCRSRKIYTSDLLRASETAEIVAHILEDARPIGAKGLIEVIREPGFREMALGAWDGKYISEIKEKYPEAYERRGRNIFKFKFDHNSENFYDLRYRVLKTLKKILKAENAREAEALQRCAADSGHFKGTGHDISRSGNRDMIIVAHKGVIQMIACALTGRPAEERWPEIANGEYIVLQM